MFREMRKTNRKLTTDVAFKVLEEAQVGVLGTISENNYPYTVFLNYVLVDKKIYFHCAKTGHKTDNILKNPNVSFSVYQNESIDEKNFTTHYQSVTCFGQARLVNNSKEILIKLIEKYAKSNLSNGKDYIDKGFQTTQIVEITIEHISGKESM
jgi:nitroimidazol reductase NimA-like FMN-containing flavoprotein (pyridoxamine 5'-phosphate oxidase superfamily)